MLRLLMAKSRGRKIEIEIVIRTMGTFNQANKKIKIKKKSVIYTFRLFTNLLVRLALASNCLICPLCFIVTCHAIYQ